jgi:hypothetical protein
MSAIHANCCLRNKIQVLLLHPHVLLLLLLLLPMLCLHPMLLLLRIDICVQKGPKLHISKVWSLTCLYGRQGTPAPAGCLPCTPTQTQAKQSFTHAAAAAAAAAATAARAYKCCCFYSLVCVEDRARQHQQNVSHARQLLLVKFHRGRCRCRCMTVVMYDCWALAYCIDSLSQL